MNICSGFRSIMFWQKQYAVNPWTVRILILSVLQDKQQILINFNFINKRALAIWEVLQHDTLSRECHVMISEPMVPLSLSLSPPFCMRCRRLRGSLTKSFPYLVSINVSHSYTQHPSKANAVYYYFSIIYLLPTTIHIYKLTCCHMMAMCEFSSLLGLSWHV